MAESKKYVLTVDSVEDALLLLAWAALGRDIAHSATVGIVETFIAARLAHGPSEEPCNRVAAALKAFTGSIKVSRGTEA